MRQSKKLMGMFMMAVFLLAPMMVVANSMEPPGLVLIIPGNHKPLEVAIIYEETTIQGTMKYWPFESQSWFGYWDGYSYEEEGMLHVRWSEGEMTLAMPSDRFMYHTTYTLDLKTGQLTEGKSLSRSMGLVGARVILTLLIEGLVFFLLGFRTKKSWVLFLVINLVTQTALNIYINTLEVAATYPIFALVFGELWVFFIEILLFTLVIKEHNKGRRLGHAFLANAASLILGGYLLTWLPV